MLGLAVNLAETIFLGNVSIPLHGSQCRRPRRKQLSDSADFLYKTTDYYAPEHERCIAWNDPAIGIDWPIDQQPSLSAKDQQGLALSDAETF